MRPRNETARDHLPTLLKRHPGAKAAKLAELAKTSPATMNRILAEARADVIRPGGAHSLLLAPPPSRGRGHLAPVCRG